MRVRYERRLTLSPPYPGEHSADRRTSLWAMTISLRRMCFKMRRFAIFRRCPRQVMIDDVIGGRHPGRRAGHEHHPPRRALRGLPEIGPRDHGGSSVRRQPAGRPLRRTGRHLGCVRPRRRRWGRVDGARADGPQPGGLRGPLRPRRRGRYPEGLVPQGISAELIAAKWGISRTRSTRSRSTPTEGRRGPRRASFSPREVAPFEGVDTDECVRVGSTPDTLAGLRPAYYDEASAPASRRSGGRSPRPTPARSATAAPPFSSRPANARRELGLRRLARLHSFAVIGDDPLLMLTAVVPSPERCSATRG